MSSFFDSIELVILRNVGVGDVSENGRLGNFGGVFFFRNGMIQ